MNSIAKLADAIGQIAMLADRNEGEDWERVRLLAEDAAFWAFYLTEKDNYGSDIDK